MPVESMTGLLNFFIVSIKKILSLSVEEILNAGTFILLRKIALSTSNGVDKKIIFFFTIIF